MDIQHVKDAAILLVDDNPTNLAVLFDYLDNIGFMLLMAQSGEKALKIIEKRKPDIILLDIVMPGIDGFETCKRLKENDELKDIPVIFMSALSETVDKVKGFEIGAVDYITKPFQQEEVLARISAHLTIRDQQKKLLEQQQKLLELNESLSRLNASKDRFFSIIAHDLKTPFTALLGMTGFLLSDFSEFNKNEMQEWLHGLHRAADSTYALLKNLLVWARLQRGSMEFKPEQIDLNKIAAANISLLTENARQKNIDLQNSVEPGTFVYADRNMTDTVLRNLLSNAVKFTGSGGKVRAAAGPDEYSREISVSDTGVGISAADKDKLFQIGERVRSKGTAEEEGTGLGLVLCKEFVERNGGRIWVESEEGKGSTFIFTLPAGTGPTEKGNQK